MSKLLLATAAVSALAAFAIPSPAQARSCLAVNPQQRTFVGAFGVGAFWNVRKVPLADIVL
jgi:hypothetical protein